MATCVCVAVAISKTLQLLRVNAWTASQNKSLKAMKAYFNLVRILFLFRHDLRFNSVKAKLCWLDLQKMSALLQEAWIVYMSQQLEALSVWPMLQASICQSVNQWFLQSSSGYSSICESIRQLINRLIDHRIDIQAAVSQSIIQFIAQSIIIAYSINQLTFKHL